MNDSLPIRKSSFQRETEDNEIAILSPSERVALMWQLTVDAWSFTVDACSFKENFNAESRLQRHIVSIRRLGD